MLTTRSVRFSLLTLAALSVAPSGLLADPLNILYYGNSFTNGAHSTRSVPYLVEQLAVAAGADAPTSVNASVGGYTLTQHLAEHTGVISTGLATGQEWDFVVLQDFSQRPTLSAPQGNRPAHLSATLGLYQEVASHSAGVTPVLYETWARAPAHSFYPTYFPDAAAMQAELRDGYDLSSANIDAFAGGPLSRIAPVGDAFEAGGFSDAFYASDDYHAQNRGTLLASLVMYGTIYGDNATSTLSIAGVLSELGISTADGALLTGLADAVLTGDDPPPPPKLDGTILVSLGSGVAQGGTDSSGSVWNQLFRNCTDGCQDITENTNLNNISLAGISDLVDSTGAATGVSLSVANPVTNNSSQAAGVLPGFTDPETGFTYDSSATTGYHFGRLTSGDSDGTYTLGNLSPDQTYELTVLSARGAGDDRNTELTVRHGGDDTTQQVNSGQNGVGGAYELARFTGLTADASGRIHLDVAAIGDGSNDFSYLNFMRLDALAATLAGDFNHDGLVDAADYSVWRDGYGVDYDDQDYDDWRANYGQSTASEPAAAAPEPSCLSLLAVVAAAGARGRRAS